jgi:hypothetical protein
MQSTQPSPRACTSAHQKLIRSWGRNLKGLVCVCICVHSWSSGPTASASARRKLEWPYLCFRAAFLNPHIRPDHDAHSEPVSSQSEPIQMLPPHHPAGRRRHLRLVIGFEVDVAQRSMTRCGDTADAEADAGSPSTIASAVPLRFVPMLP